jgi:hypothetical protein
MTGRKCNYPHTANGEPCDNPVSGQGTRCAAGHPVTLVVHPGDPLPARGATPGAAFEAEDLIAGPGPVIFDSGIDAGDHESSYWDIHITISSGMVDNGESTMAEAHTIVEAVNESEAIQKAISWAHDEHPMTDPRFDPIVSVDSVEEFYGDEDRCACGASLDDGEGYDGKCGNCADRAEARRAKAA